MVLQLPGSEYIFQASRSGLYNLPGIRTGVASLARPVFNVIKFKVYKIAYMARSYIRPNLYIYII